MMNIPNMVRNAGRASLLLIFGAALAGCNAPSATQDATPPLAGAKIGGPFSLTDQDGKPVRDSDFAGRYRIVYFGYSYCPDICPTDLQQIGLAMDQLGDSAESVQPLFITLDPERDTAEHLAQYVPLFHPRLIGLTGSTDAVRNAADAYRVYYKRVTTGSRPDDYTVDHSAFIYLMDRDGKYLTFFPPGTDAAKIVGMVRAYLRGGAER